MTCEPYAEPLDDEMPRSGSRIFITRSRVSLALEESIDAAIDLYNAIGDHMPSVYFPESVEEAWKRLGEPLSILVE